MELILPIIFGWAGGILGFRWTDGEGWERNPPRCIMCAGFAGAVLAVIVELILRTQLNDAGFFGHVVVDLASGVVGSTLIGGGYGMMTRGRTNR